MRVVKRAKFLLHITNSHGIIRRYFVVNGFDGALTMLGLIIGFLLSKPSELSVIINACLGAAIALGMSGFSSAYVSELAERKKALGELESAMSKDLQTSRHGQAARIVPWLIALVNGSSPLIISLIILLPLFLARGGIDLLFPPLYFAIFIALVLVFLLGAFLGNIADISWFRSGVQTLIIAVFTALFIYLFVTS